MLGLALAMMPISDKCQLGASASAIVRAHEIVTVTVASSRAVTEEEETVESIGTMMLNYLNEGYLQEPEVSTAHCCTLQSDAQRDNLPAIQKKTKINALT